MLLASILENDPSFHRVLENECGIANIKMAIRVSYKWRERKQAMNDLSHSMYITTRVLVRVFCDCC